MITKLHHHYHLSPSPWPVLASIMSFNLLFSGALFFKFSECNLFLVNLFFIAGVSFAWWFNYSEEMNLVGLTSYSLESGLKMSMLLFISSEVMFFFSFFWAYFHFSSSPCMEASMEWPPTQVEMFDFSNVPLINTLVLLSSGMFATMAHHFMMEGKMKNCFMSLSMTVILGFIFSYLQLKEYQSSFFGVSDSTFGTTFFVLTGFHGIHVLVGTIFILFCLIQSMGTSCSKNYCVSMELSFWYWHFVDVVWLFLYFIIYYLNA